MSIDQSKRPSFSVFACELPEKIELSWQSPLQKVTLYASNLDFVPKITEFVTETINNPNFRDKVLENGHYELLQADIDVSDSFIGTDVFLRKNGEYDDAYVVVINGDHIYFHFEFRGEEVENFLSSLDEIEDLI